MTRQIVVNIRRWYRIEYPNKEKRIGDRMTASMVAAMLSVRFVANA